MHGGEIPETYGVPVEQICEGIKHGVRKVNIDTDLRLASTGIIRQYLAKNPAAFDPRVYLKESIAAMKDIAVARYKAFGTEGNASKIKPLGLEGMAGYYSDGA
jgi:fructose-bisphosphate aldolase class II